MVLYPVYVDWKDVMKMFFSLPTVFIFLCMNESFNIFSMYVIVIKRSVSEKREKEW